MATAIQLLRSAVPHLRPDPGVLADGMPMVNLAEESPGLYFRLANGTLTKIGPAHIGSAAPNATPQGHSGNTIGELWFDNTDANKISLKSWDGTQWIEISPEVSEISPTPPASPNAGDLWYDSTNNELLYWNGSQWISTSSVDPGGVNTQIQFNDVGQFGGDANLTFNKTTGTLATQVVTLDELSGRTATFTEDVIIRDLFARGGTFTGDITGVNADFTEDITSRDLTLSRAGIIPHLSGNTIVLTDDPADANLNGDLTAKKVTSLQYDLTVLNTLP